MVKIILIILNSLLKDERFIQKLADSYPVRRAAQLLVYYYNKNKPKALEFRQMLQLDGLKLTEKLKKIAEDLEKREKRLKYAKSNLKLLQRDWEAQLKLN